MVLVINLIKNRPSLHYRIMKYRGESTWDRQSYHFDTKVNYIKYFESFSSQSRVSLPGMRKNFLNKIEYTKLKLEINSTNIQEKENMKSFRRKMGYLRIQQLDLIYNYDLNILNKMFDPQPSFIMD